MEGETFLPPVGACHQDWHRPSYPLIRKAETFGAQTNFTQLHVPAPIRAQVAPIKFYGERDTESHADRSTHMDKAEQFMTYEEAMEKTGLSLRTLHERMQRDGITRYINPRDNRRRFLAAEDVQKLMEMRPAPRREMAAA